MLVAAIDFEATDKIPETARITEIGAVLFEADHTWTAQGEFSQFVYDPSYPPQSEEVIRVTGITDEMLKKDGARPQEALEKLLTFVGRAEYIMAYNVDYDRVLLEHESKRLGLPVISKEKWVCALRDVPYPEFYTCRKLAHLALDHGCFFDPKGLHRAVNDVKLMGQLLVEGGYTIEQMLKYRDEPTYIARAMVSYDERELAKAERFSWEKLGDQTFPKMWVKQVKASAVADLKKRCEARGFKIARIK
jgi:DNA polymerase III epsilon subunit-like protein